MKKILFFVLAALTFAACEQALVEEQSAICPDVPETITVGFEGDDTRIQLNEDVKTVWTKGDLVSVFYRSDANQKWQYTGETGARTADLTCVDAGEATATMNGVVVVYPYSENYYINTETYTVQATLPVVQNYLKDSYGLNGNIMISQSEYNNFSLKNVCGWLKLQLTGNGEKIKSITVRGNNGEQVAGEAYINTTDATMTLAADKLATDDDGEVSDSLIFEDTILTEVTLDCGEGVELGAEATAFYIALPPQTFTKGLTVEITAVDGSTMTKSTGKELVIERNHIQPMKAFVYDGVRPQPNNEITYTSTDGKSVSPFRQDDWYILSHTYNAKDGIGVYLLGTETRIGYEAFWGRDRLKSITIPNSVTSIGERAFYHCDGLTSVTIGDSLTIIENYAFSHCKSLTSVNIPNSVTTIGENAFEYCESLTSVTIPDSVTTIGEEAFHSCYNLTSVNIPNSVTTIEYATFSSCDLTSVTIPNSVTTIGEEAFSWCDKLTSVTIPDSVTTIGYEAFWRCGLLSVTIPNSVTTIEGVAFAGCHSLKEFKGKFAADGGRCLIVDNTILAYAEASGTEYTIPDSVMMIGEGAFSWCTNLTSVTIPDSVTSIGDIAFYHCDGLTSVTIPDSVTTIGVEAFYHCDGLTSATIGDGVTTIGDYAFYWCKPLESVTIGDSVTTIGKYAFAACKSLATVYCKPTTPPTTSNVDMFNGASSSLRIYVPINSVDAYKNAERWSKYASAIVGYDFNQ